MIETLSQFYESFKHYSDESNEAKLEYFDLLGLSWALHLIYTFYSVFTLYLGVRSYEYLASSKDFTHIALQAINFKFQKIGLLTTLFSVVFYPFIFQFAYKFWKGCFKFYAQIFDFEIELLEEKSDAILTRSFSSNLFLLIPILGKTLSNMAFAFFLFNGLKKKYDFSSLQAALVVATPLFLLFLFAIFSASYFLFYIYLALTGPNKILHFQC